MSKSRDEVFDSLVKNAFYFLEYSVKSIESSPKISLVLFCAAVEMFLKARLMKEDWSLIVDDPKKAKYNDFISGDFKSASYTNLQKRLNKYPNGEIPKETAIIFQKLATHRNKLIHFFNADLDNSEVCTQIAAEQLKSWDHLSVLLKKWDTYFDIYSEKMQDSEELMKRNLAFLKKKYQDILPVIQQKINSGKEFLLCYNCSFGALPKIQPQDIAYDSQCLLCGAQEMQFFIQCKKCKTPIFCRHDINEGCSQCGYEVNESNAVLVLETQLGYHTERQQDDEVDWIANCTECDSKNSVIKIADHKWLCTACYRFIENK